MENLFELLLTVILAGAGLYGIYWLVNLLKGKLPEPVYIISLVVFIVMAIVIVYVIAFKNFRVIQL